MRTGVIKGMGSALPEQVLTNADLEKLADTNDEAGTRKAIEANPDIAAVIIEPTGASFGRVPVKPSFLTFLRKITKEKGIVLIFDEVFVGFRLAPGGAQEYFSVRADMVNGHGSCHGGFIFALADSAFAFEIGRASCRERV